MGKKVYAGIDLGGTSIKFGFFSPNGELLDKWSIPTRRDNGGAYILSDIRDSLLERAGDDDEICAVGMGVPGAVKNQKSVAPCVNLNQWGGPDIAGDLSHMLGDIPVGLVNDANAAALGEMWQGSAKGYKSLVFITLGTGVGSGIVINGKLVEGAHGAAGEAGHIKINTQETECCGCGKKGCLEQYASATGVVRTAKEILKERFNRDTLENGETVSCQKVFEMAKAGDPVFLEAVERFAKTLGQALAAISCVCDPEIFIIGGGVSHAGEWMLNKVKAEFVKYAFPASEETIFKIASLENDAGIYGSAFLASEIAVK